MLPFLFLQCWLLGRALLFYFAFGHSLSMYLFLALHLGCSCLRLLSHQWDWRFELPRLVQGYC